ncbi:MAG: hypothetical protein QOF77_627 [Solirubrobacteraceae bacterium]|jgi:hypothetical protein|nr:hypothetical protein [Solirubrobacteraceae bacterium]
MSETKVQMCIYPGCERPAVPPHDMGGPQPHFCDLDEHNAGSAHLARQKAAGNSPADGGGDEASA